MSDISNSDNAILRRISIEIREEQAPYFSMEDIFYYYEKNNRDINATIYELLILKSEDSSITLSGLSTQDTSSYFLRLASRYKRFNTGVLTGGWYNVVKYEVWAL